MPNTAFKNAGTKVTADILFLQKREREIENPEWTTITEDAQGFRINSYFVQHPEMILGTMQEISGPYGMETTCVEKEGVPLGERLRAAISHITGHIPERVEEERAEFRYEAEQPTDAPMLPRYGCTAMYYLTRERFIIKMNPVWNKKRQRKQQKHVSQVWSQ